LDLQAKQVVLAVLKVLIAPTFSNLSNFGPKAKTILKKYCDFIPFFFLRLKVTELSKN